MGTNINNNNHCPYHNTIIDSCNYCIAIAKTGHFNNNIANITTSNPTEKQITKSCCHSPTKKNRLDWLFITGLVITIFAYMAYQLSWLNNIDGSKASYIISFIKAIYSIINEMFIGIVLGTIAIFLLNFIPKPMLYKILGNKKGVGGILRAITAGVIFDVCSCGVYLIAAKLYKQGVRLPQIIGFLCATPWNSLSLTFVMVALIGLKFTIAFIALSLVVAVVTALIFEFLLSKKILPENKNTININTTDETNKELPFKQKITSGSYLISTSFSTIKESKVIVKWLLVGGIIAAAVRTFVPDSIFQTYFGPSTLGLLLTSVIALIVETCSQGTLPLAAELITKAGAIGNAFVFLMMGVATNISQALVLKEVTKSWKVPLLLAVFSVPQIIILGFILNNIFRVF